MLSNNILKELRKQGKSQLWLSFETKIASQDLSQVANGKKICWPAWRQKISMALGVSEEELFPNEKGGEQCAG
jgi:lambda repressor-like predicted transcriptional regulator